LTSSTAPKWGGFGLQELQHLRLDIDRDDLAFRQQAGDAERVIPRAGADVGQDRVRREFEQGDGLGRSLFLLAVGTLEPADAWMAHDVGDLASHESLADAVAGRRAAAVNGRRRRRRRRRRDRLRAGPEEQGDRTADEKARRKQGLAFQHNAINARRRAYPQAPQKRPDPKARPARKQKRRI
jgi:hypothetical protein